MQKLMILTLFLIALWSLPTYAQSGTCVIDLSSAAATLVQAQAQASSGDNPAAIAKLRELQAQIDAIIANCDWTATTSLPDNTPIPTEPLPLLTNTPQPRPTIPPIARRFTAQNGVLSFLLPAGWVANEQGNSVFIGASADTANAVSSFNPPIGTELGAGLIVGTPQQLAPTLREGANFVDVLVAYRSQLNLNGFTTSEDLTPVTWRDNPGGRFIFASPTITGIIQVIDLQSSELHLLIFVASQPEQSGQLEALLIELLDSVEINL